MRNPSPTSAPLTGAEAVFVPETVAIVGASDRGSGFSKALYQNLHGRFTGRVYLINPSRKKIWRQPCYAGFAEVPERVDLALVVVPGGGVPGVLEDGRAHGLRAAILYNERFGGADPESEARAGERVAAVARGGDAVRLVGPNSLGALAVERGGIFYPMSAIAAVPAGSVGVVSASGGALQHWVLQGAARGLGFSYAVSTGNELDLGLADYVEFLAADESTHVICAIVEGIRQPAAFARAAGRALAARKPIVMLKIGRSRAAQRSVASHTGALAGDDAVFDAVCTRYGITRVTSLDDMLEIALAFRSGRLPAGSRVGMVCHSGGLKGHFLDALDAEGLRCARLAGATERRLHELGEPVADNPHDGGMRLAIDAEAYGRVCRAFADDPNIDVLALQGRLPTGEGNFPHKVGAYNALFDEIAKPVVAFERMGYNVARQQSAATTMPFLQGIPETARALGALVRYAARVRSEPGAPAAVELPSPARTPPPGGIEPVTRVWDLLRQNGVQAPRERRVRSEAEARAAAGQLTPPLVVKLATSDVHKTELGAVRVGIRNAAELVAAMNEIGEQLRATPGALAAGFLVQEVAVGVELIVGAREDPQFGPILVVGFGGTIAEVVHDVAIRLLPVDEDEVPRMLASLRGRELLAGFRGRPERDLAAIASAAAGLGNAFLAGRSWLAELEINPLIVGATGDGARAVDVRFALRGAHE